MSADPLDLGKFDGHEKECSCGRYGGPCASCLAGVELQLAAPDLLVEVVRLREELEGARGLCRAAVRTIHALAADERGSLHTVNEGYQQDVDVLVLLREEVGILRDRLGPKDVRCPKCGMASAQVELCLMCDGKQVPERELTALRESHGRLLGALKSATNNGHEHDCRWAAEGRGNCSRACVVGMSAIAAAEKLEGV